MGGWGSGRQGLNDPKRLTSDFLRIDVRRLAQLKFFGEERCAYGTLASPDGKSIAFACHRYQIELRYSFHGESLCYPVALDWTVCHYGGKRPWFLCPGEGCGKRVAVLFGGKYFLCRKCRDLTYPCQREELADRASRRVDKIRARLGWEPGWMNFYRERPKGMHANTYLRLTREHLRHVQSSYDAIRRRIGTLADDFGFDEGIEIAQEAVNLAARSRGRFDDLGDRLGD